MEPGEAQLLHWLALLQVPLGAVAGLGQACICSPYGRHVTPGGACQLPARAAWALQELPSLAAPLLLLLGRPPPLPPRWPNCLLLAMFLLHYAHRNTVRAAYEAIVFLWNVREPSFTCFWGPAFPPLSLVFPFLIRGGKPTAFYLFVISFLYCAFNGYLQGCYLIHHAVYADDWLTDPRFLAGSLLWLVGLLINIHSDHILRTLRKPGETGYKIPRGGLFEYVTAANYFGEVVEWSGFALASWSLQGASFMLFTFMVLCGRAHLHHWWYLEKFEDYPKSRKVFIPFVL